MQRRVLERWSALFGACALAGAFYHYTVFVLVAPNTRGVVESVLRDTVNERVPAPFQYRFLVPCVLVWLSDHPPLTLPTASTALDMAMLAIGAALGVSMLRRTGLGLFALPALLYCAFLILGPALYWKPETMTAFACVTAALMAMQRPSRADGWWSDRVTSSALVIAAAILIGCRTDLLFALGAGFAMRWWQRRERFDLLAAAVLVMTCTVATLALIRVFPDAHYPRGVGPV